MAKTRLISLAAARVMKRRFECSYELPDCLFPTDNELEIPSLLPELQAETIDVPFVCFGEQRRTMDMSGRGTLHFYTEDYRFNTVFEHPEKIIKHFPRNVIEANFSMFDTTPIALGLSAIYKKRYLDI